MWGTPFLLQRCATHFASITDALKGYLWPARPPCRPVNGDTDKLVALERKVPAKPHC